jgi:hypothetical protein
VVVPAGVRRRALYVASDDMLTHSVMVWFTLRVVKTAGCADLAHAAMSADPGGTSDRYRRGEFARYSKAVQLVRIDGQRRTRGRIARIVAGGDACSGRGAILCVGVG